MKYVLDSNVAIKWVLPEPDTPKAVKLINNLQPAFPFITSLASLP
jgi:hypothetical protein